jgi:hypothetical protein
LRFLVFFLAIEEVSRVSHCQPADEDEDADEYAIIRRKPMNRRVWLKSPEIRTSPSEVSMIRSANT